MTQTNNGSTAASAFRETFLEIFGRPSNPANEGECLSARWLDTPLGAMLAIAGAEGLYLLEFADRPELENEILRLRKRSGAVISPATSAVLEETSQELNDYFAGKSLRFSVPLVPQGTPFDLKVWALLQTIPPGATWSYLQLASQLGQPTATRAVGHANGRNSLAIVIPCHRLIRSDGSLCGYGGGLWRKRWLLEHERKVA